MASKVRKRLNRVMRERNAPPPLPPLPYTQDELDRAWETVIAASPDDADEEDMAVVAMLSATLMSVARRDGEPV